MSNRRSACAAAVALLLGAGLSGCTSDPAFWENLQYAADSLAYELEANPACPWVPNGYGGVVQRCSDGYVGPSITPAPTYVEPAPHRRDDGRRHDGDRGGHDGHRRGKIK